jgi:hypothetical protein
MNLPPGSSNDRRTVPRHIRDAEHHPWENGAVAPDQAEAPRRRPKLWIVLALLAVFAGAWVAISSTH